MRSLTLLLAVILTVPASVYGLDLVGHRVPNSGNRCSAACIETAGRAAGIYQLEGFITRTSGPGYMDHIFQRLKEENVRNICIADWIYERDILRDFAESNGVVVTMIAGADFIDLKGCHSILVKKYDEVNGLVEYYDPNHQLENKSITLAQFNKFWSGNAIVVFADDYQLPVKWQSVASAKKLSTKTEQAPAQENVVVDGVELTPVENNMLTKLNNFRKRMGLSPCKVTKALMDRARNHAKWMARNNSMTHSTGVQENIAAGQRSSEEVTNVWINSSGHNANMRTGNPNVGLSVATAPNGTHYWVQQFGR